MILNVGFDMFYACILASNILKQRQKVIRIADISEMGWKVVDEYIQSEVASDEEDQKRIHRAQSRVARKAKSDRGRRARQYFPYGRSFGGRRPRRSHSRSRLNSSSNHSRGVLGPVFPVVK